jgi:hypothetical protein
VSGQSRVSGDEVDSRDLASATQGGSAVPLCSSCPKLVRGEVKSYGGGDGAEYGGSPTMKTRSKLESREVGLGKIRRVELTNIRLKTIYYMAGFFIQREKIARTSGRSPGRAEVAIHTKAM